MFHVEVAITARNINRYSTRNIGSKRNIGGKKIIAQVCIMRMRMINPLLFSPPHIRGIKGDCCIGWVGDNPLLFSPPCIRGIKGDCCIGWVGGEWEVSRRLRQGLSPALV
jgi:hypothetical protein